MEASFSQKLEQLHGKIRLTTPTVTVKRDAVLVFKKGNSKQNVKQHAKSNTYNTYVSVCGVSSECISHTRQAAENQPDHTVGIEPATFWFASPMLYPTELRGQVGSSGLIFSELSLVPSISVCF